MSRPVLLEVTAKAIAPEVMAAYKDGQLDIRLVPKGSGSYVLQAWAVAVYGPGKPAEYAFGTALRKVGLILGQRTERPGHDPGGGASMWANYADTPEVKIGRQNIIARAREAAGAVIEELGKAGYHPIEGRTGAGLIALANVLNSVCQMAMNRPKGSNNPVAPVAESKTTVKRRFVIEAPQPNTELEDPPTFQIGDKLRRKMAGALANIAKDMMHGQATRIIPFLKGSARTAIAVSYEGIEDENGMPVAYIRAKVPNIKRSADGRSEYRPYALVKIFHDVDRQTVQKSPGKVAFADIEFEATRGHELAQAFTKWVDDWVPIHNTSMEAGRTDDDPQGNAVRGAPKARAHSQFKRTDIVVNLNRLGFTGKGPLRARLMVSPIVTRTVNLSQDGLKGYRVLSLHRTMPDGAVSSEVLRNMEQEVLVAATVAIDEDESYYTAYGLLFNDQFRGREPPIMYALIDAIMRAASQTSGMPQRFKSPLEYEFLNKAMSKDERALWSKLDNNTPQQSADDTEQDQVNDEVAQRLFDDDDMNDWFPDANNRKSVIVVAISDAIANPRGIDITDPDRLFRRAKALAQARI